MFQERPADFMLTMLSNSGTAYVTQGGRFAVSFHDSEKLGAGNRDESKDQMQSRNKPNTETPRWPVDTMSASVL
jgi:hypothetical protein